MKKRNYLIITLLLMMSMVLAACGGGGGGVELTQEGDNINIMVTVPEGEDGEPAYAFSTEEADLINYADSVLIGEKVTISFDTTNHTFQTSIFFEEEHGEVENPTFEQYKDFMVNDPYDVVMNHASEVTTASREAIEFEFLNTVTRVLNTDDISDLPTFIYIRPVNEDDSILDLMAEEDIKAVIDSIEIAGK